MRKAIYLMSVQFTKSAMKTKVRSLVPWLFLSSHFRKKNVFPVMSSAALANDRENMSCKPKSYES